MSKTIDVRRFEVVTAPSGNVLVAFIGNIRLEEGAAARFDGNALAVARGALPAVRFVGLTPDDVAAVRRAGLVLVNRTFKDGTNETTAVRLAAM